MKGPYQIVPSIAQGRGCLEFGPSFISMASEDALSCVLSLFDKDIHGENSKTDVGKKS